MNLPSTSFNVIRMASNYGRKSVLTGFLWSGGNLSLINCFLRRLLAKPEEILPVFELLSDCKYARSGSDTYALKLSIILAIFQKRFVFILRCVTVVVLMGSTAYSQCFVNSTLSSGDLRPYDVAKGDFNGDGKQDLAVTGFNSLFNSLVYILLGTGTGSFQIVAIYSSGSESVAVGDFNGDGKQDLVFANGEQGAPGTVSVRLGSGTGTFGAATRFATGGSFANQVEVGDFNEDGADDVVVTNYFSNDVSLLLGTGTGSLSQPTIFSTGGLQPYSIALSDYNRDGNLDVAIAHINSSNITVLLGTGTGSMAPDAAFTPTLYASILVAGDINNDGKTDLVGSAGTVASIHLGLGDAGFAPGTYVPVFSGNAIYFVALEDFNNDGNLDIVATVSTVSKVVVLLGDGTGNFGAGTEISLSGEPYTIQLGDFNNDGKPDFVTANLTGKSITTLLNCADFRSVSISPKSIGALCSGTNLPVEASANGFTPISHTWSSQPAGFSGSGSSPLLPVPTVVSPTTYTLSVSATDGTITKTASTTLVVNPLPAINISPFSTTLTCTSSTVSLTASGGETYLWSTGATTSIINVTVADTYSVTVTAANGCTATTSATISDNTIPPTVILSASTTAVTAGQSVTLTASTGMAYQWSTGATDNSISVVPPTGTTSYSVIVTNAAGCSGTAAISITAAGGSDLISGPNQLCVKSAPPGRESVSVPLTMTVVGTPSSYSYAWSYKAPNSINYKSIPVKGVTIGKVSLVPGGSVPYSLVITGTKGNLNSLQGYLIRLTVSNSQGSDFAETLLNGGCELGSSTARMGVFTAEALQVQVYPNPVTEVLQVKINGLNQPASVRLFDLQGRPQSQWRVVPAEGMGELQAPVTQLPEGLYLLQVETASGVLHRQRVLKQR